MCSVNKHIVYDYIIVCIYLYGGMKCVCLHVCSSSIANQ
jgi:hypothetical protein